MFLSALALTLFGCSIAYWTMVSISKQSYNRPLIFNNSIAVIIISILWICSLSYGLYLFWKINLYIVVGFFSMLLFGFLAGTYFAKISVRAKKIFKIYKRLKANFPHLDEKEIYRETAILYYKSIKWRDEKINLFVDQILKKSDNSKLDGLTEFVRTILIYEDPLENDFENGFDIYKYMNNEAKIDKSIENAFHETFKNIKL